MSRLNCRNCNQSQITELVQPIAAFAPPAQFVSAAYVVLNISILDVREIPSVFALSSTKTENTWCMLQFDGIFMILVSAKHSKCYLQTVSCGNLLPTVSVIPAPAVRGTRSYLYPTS